MVKRQTHLCHANRHWFAGDPFSPSDFCAPLGVKTRRGSLNLKKIVKASMSLEICIETRNDEKQTCSNMFNEICFGGMLIRCRRLKVSPWTTAPSFLAIPRIRLQRSAQCVYAHLQHMPSALHLGSQGNATCPAQLGRVELRF